jgi:hypothetical protein
MTNLRVAAKMSIDEGHDAVRRQFANWSFDSERLDWAVSDLGMYSAEYDEKTGLFKDTPARSPYKHTADAIRTFAVSTKLPSHDLVAKLPRQSQGMYDIYEGRELYGSTSSTGRMYPSFAR